MNKRELNKILSLHKKWLNEPTTGLRANLSSVDPAMLSTCSELNLTSAILKYLNLQSCTLIRANFQGADLHGTNFNGACMHSTNFSRANLSHVKFCNANLTGVDFSYACLAYADLTGAKLYGANFQNADLRGAKLDGIRVDEHTSFLAPQCPEEGSFIGWKKLRNGAIAKLFIPANAKRSSATSLKCRASKAKVVAIFDIKNVPIKEGISIHYANLVYKVGQTVVPEEPFDSDRFNECSAGIHFFMSRIIAENY